MLGRVSRVREMRRGFWFDLVQLGWWWLRRDFRSLVSVTCLKRHVRLMSFIGCPRLLHHLNRGFMMFNGAMQSTTPILTSYIFAGLYCIEVLDSSFGVFRLSRFSVSSGIRVV